MPLSLPAAPFFRPDAQGRLTPAQLAELDKVARHVRAKVIEIASHSGAAHIASSLSPVDILTAAYCTLLRIDPKQPADPARDLCIFSKGHAAMALYCMLCARGFFPPEYLDRFAKHGSELAEQPAPYCAPGVELATGSLGHGLPVGVGSVLASRIRGISRRVLVISSDGECNEGSVWEAALFAPAHKMSELMLVIDFNKWQATGRSQEVMALDDFRAKWEAFRWRAFETDGHDLAELVRLLNLPPDEEGRPTAIVAHTVKGKGVSFMEDDNNWHYLAAKEVHVKQAFAELGITS